MNATTHARHTNVIRHLTVVIVAIAALCLVPASASAIPKKVYSPHKKALITTRGTKLVGSVIATWYGPGFYGNSTGCGTTLKRGTWGIAHRTLPCGSMVYLSYNGRRIAVPVIDRGPYSGATIDLTERVAEKLGFKNATRPAIRLGLMRQKLRWRQYS